MNTAVILHGLVHRSLNYTHQSLLNNLINPLNADVFFHSWNFSDLIDERTNEVGLKLNINHIKQFLPNANGIIENQDDFMIFNTDISIHNYICDLESQSRAFTFFETNKKKHYDRVIIARPDVYYLQTINLTEKIDDQSIIVANFHHWDGINDRFAVGSEQIIKKYCNRKNTIIDWINKKGVQKNSEQYLADYLKINNIEVQFIDFVFQRVRANGEIAKFDQKFS